MTKEQRLHEIRARIDKLDEQIQALISQRAQVAKEIAEVKLASNGNSVFYRPEREAAVLHKVMAHNQGPLSDASLAVLFREIMSACLALQQPLNIAFLGPEGTFTQDAALKHFGHAGRRWPLGAIDEVFREVESGAAHYGVVPIENSTEGAVNHTLDMFLRSPLRICGEVELRIHHHLMSKENALAAIHRVYSHRQSLAQCRGWLERNLAHAERFEISSNAEAARLAASIKEVGVAAIAGEAAAELYELPLLAKNIEDRPDNTTRFLVIGNQEVPPTGRDKTSLLLSAPNTSGALYRLLEPFARQGITLTRIESRPSHRETWDYVFFVDLEGHIQDPNLAEAIRALNEDAAMVKVLGSYPKAVIP